MSGATPACRIKINAAGDWQVVPPAGQITQIGNAGATAHGLVNNDDLFVSGKLEVNGSTFFDGFTIFDDTGRFESDAVFYLDMDQRGRWPGTSAKIIRDSLSEILTIPIGQGAAGVVTAANLAPVNSTMIGCVCRVTQPPGGGATTIDIGRTGGGNLDEFIDGIATALGTTGTFAANHDAATIGPVLNAAADTLTLTTDANVVGVDMKVKIVVFFRREVPPT